MFTKAAGCTTMRTVKASCALEELRRQTLPLRSPHTNFMTEHGDTLDDAPALTGVPRKEAAKRAFFDSLAQRLAVDVAVDIRHEAPLAPTPKFSPERGDPKEEPPELVRMADTALRQMSVELFRKYFSPSMHLIFPLIAHQQALHGLDFTTTQTWGVRHAGRNVGAVAWRMRKPLLAVHEGDASRLPVLTLEVLFISVWEQYRHSDCGAVMVAALEEEARGCGCGFMYVEIGQEQPLARRFWGKSGFCTAREAGVTQEQSLFFEHACLRFADTEQFVKRLSA
jgi:GNAT superfamily N-acetyltransferase